jgi:hypothetical protein
MVPDTRKVAPRPTASDTDTGCTVSVTRVTSEAEAPEAAL